MKSETKEELVIQIKGKHRKGWRYHRIVDLAFLDLSTKRDRRWLETELGAVREAFPSSEVRLLNRVAVITEEVTSLEELLSLGGQE